MLVRNVNNPLIRPQDVVPSRADFEIIGTFNAGAVRSKSEIILLVRVAERPVRREPGYIFYPHMDDNGALIVRRLAETDPRYDISDVRVIRDRVTDEVILTSISHLRVARSTDGIHFAIEDKASLTAQQPFENFGVEDARIVKIDGLYYINYSAVSQYGIATALVSTMDFVYWTRHGLILPPANRDVVLFPERINGQYICYHRPMPAMIGGLNMWMATSPDLIHWGEHQMVLSAQVGGWEAGRVGGGAPPMRTPQGWLSIYHAADPQNRYCLGAFLTPLDDPGHVIARTDSPILAPEADYETHGFFKDVVFTCGALLEDGLVHIYYGAADEVIALATLPLSDIINNLKAVG